MAARGNSRVGKKRTEASLKSILDARFALQKPLKEKVAVALTAEELAELDALAAALGNLPRTSCIRLALKRLAQVELS